MLSSGPNRIPVIDLFAGPGGLGEGFSAFSSDAGYHPFDVVLSIEKDPDAHRTLFLRSFFRQFGKNGKKIPDDYYSFLRGEIDLNDLFSRHAIESGAAKNEAILAELGSDSFSEEKLDELVENALGDNDSWVLIGGPPCQAFSCVGRSRNRGIIGYVPENDPRHFLYREYLGIIARHWPPIFLMENVKGILSAKINGARIFDHIISDLRDPAKATTQHRPKSGECFSYSLFSLVTGKDASGKGHDNPKDFVIHSEDFGIPQTRHRVLILGIRNDLVVKGIEPPRLTKGINHVPVLTAISNLPFLRSGLSKNDSRNSWANSLACSLEADWYKEIPDKEVRDCIESTVFEIKKGTAGIGYTYEKGKPFIPTKSENIEQKGTALMEWLQDERIGGVCNHEAKSHREDDLHRYLFVACFTKVKRKPPRLGDFPISLLPKHNNVELAVKGNSYFSDRFRAQIEDAPSKTITCHIAKDGHYYIHYDPKQCRSLTVRECARLQTFPDNYFFCGSRTAQYTQVGNAVPPLLACQIAQEIYLYYKKSIIADTNH